MGDSGKGKDFNNFKRKRNEIRFNIAACPNLAYGLRQ